jgi:hypothetical protein
MSKTGRVSCGVLILGLLAGAPALWAQGSISVLPKSITLRAAAGQFSPLNYNLTLSNSGTDALSWEAASSAPWLKLPVSSGTANPGNTGISIQANPGSLEAGVHSGSVGLNFPGSTVPVVVIAVRLQLDALAPVSGLVTINFLSSPLPSQLIEARTEAQTTVLDDGRVLITGGSGDSGDLQSAELYSSGGFGTIVQMNGPRRRHTATLLASGEVLVAGGIRNGVAHSTVELFRPSDDAFQAASPMLENRYFHAAVGLPDKRVLVAGGYDFSNQVLASTELYDRASGAWQAGPALNTPRARGVLSLLADGRVLITGGVTSDGSRTASAEIFDPAAGSWRPAASMAAARQQHTATVLPKGQVLVAGGWDGRALASTEVYDPAADTWTAGAALSAARYDHYAFLLPAGVVAFVGGWQGDSTSANAQVEVYHPASGEPGGSVLIAGSTSARVLQAAALLPSGQILNAGGLMAIGSRRLFSADLISIEALQTTVSGSLAAAPPSLSFAAPSAALTQTISISNAGTGTLTWTASVDQPWVSLDATLGTCPAAISVKVNLAGLAPGAYQANVRVVSTDAVNSPLVIPVTLSIRVPAVLTLSAQTITIDALAGTIPQPQVVQVTNSGGGTLTWTAVSDARWLTLDPSGGSAPGASILNLNMVGMQYGVYQATVTFTSPEAVNGPQTVSVTVRLLRAPQIGLLRSSLDIVALPGRDPDPITVAISNTTGAAVAWSATSSQPWLLVTPYGWAPGSAVIQVSSRDLPPGKYGGEIVFEAPGASNSPRSLYVYLEVRAGFEPFLSLFLNPGFYIVEATLDAGAQAGWFGTETSVAKARMDGGFIQGGPIWGSGEDAATLTFTLPSRMRVSAVMSAAAGAGGDRSAFGFSLRILDSSGRQVGNPAGGASAAQLTQDLNAGTYTAEIRTRDGSPAGSYQLTLTAPFLAGATGAGYLAPNSVAFGAFYIPEAQTVRMRLIGHRDSGPWGAGDMVLTLKDASRRVLRVVDRTGAHLP